MTDTTREYVERLLDGVTEGPWLYRPGHYDDWGVVKAQDRQICQARHPDRLESKVLSEYRANGLDPWEANARFIAAARELVPALLARAEAAEAERNEEKAYADTCNKLMRKAQSDHEAAESALAAMAQERDAERETVARLTEALQRVIALDDTAECCGQGICGGYSPPECCGQPLYGFDRAQNIARAALLTGKPVTEYQRKVAQMKEDFPNGI